MKHLWFRSGIRPGLQRWALINLNPTSQIQSSLRQQTQTGSLATGSVLPAVQRETTISSNKSAQIWNTSWAPECDSRQCAGLKVKKHVGYGRKVLLYSWRFPPKAVCWSGFVFVSSSIKRLWLVPSLKKLTQNTLCSHKKSAAAKRDSITWILAKKK